MQNEKIVELHKDITELYKEVKEALSPETPFNEDYLGFQVYYSPIVINPKLMFIGINPGPGKTEVEDIDEKTELEYIDGGYTLANETEKVFRDIDKYEYLEESSFKINYYYLITKSENHLNDSFYKLPSSLQSKFEIKSEEFTLRYIDIIKPEIIICESSTIYNDMKELLNTEPIETNEKNCYLSISKDRNFHLVGYARTFSFIRNKEGLGKVIKSIL